MGDQLWNDVSDLLYASTIGLLWFVHYGMMHYMKAFPPMLSFINAMVSLSVGWYF